MNSFQELADEVPVERQAVQLKLLAYALGTNVRVLYYETTHTFSMVMSGLQG
jgi:hypothetical protein